MDTDHKIMVSGMGIQCAIADSIPSFVSALREGHSAMAQLTQEQAPLLKPTIAALLQNFILKEQLAKISSLPNSLLIKAEQLTRRAPLPIQTSVVCALQAWEEAKLNELTLPSNRIGIVVACDNASQAYIYETLLKFNQTPEYLSPRYAIHSLETDHVGIISELLQLQGEGFVVGGASASGNVALIKASQIIQLGLVDACLVIGALSDLSQLALQGFYNIGAMGGHHFNDAPSKACRPFDREHEGFIYGQGCACIILEKAESVKKRKINPIAEWLGGALLLDGSSQPAPSELGEATVMRRCLEVSKTSASCVDYINAHGSSSPLGDITEVNSIKKVFGDHIDKIWINSTKSLTGHCLFAAGLIEAIACIVQMNHHFIHPNINLNNTIDDTCRFAPDKETYAHVNIAMNNSFGFGGINSSILLKKVH